MPQTRSTAFRRHLKRRDDEQIMTKQIPNIGKTTDAQIKQNCNRGEVIRKLLGWRWGWGFDQFYTRKKLQ